MTGFTTAALVYAPDIPAPELQQLLLQMSSIGVESETVDRVTFDGIDGGSVERRLAIPYLAGMDAVEVRDAGLSLAGEQLAFSEPAPVKTLSSAAGDIGIVLALGRRARWRRVVLRYPSFPDGAFSDASDFAIVNGSIQITEEGAPPQQLRVVVRLGLPDGSFGPPAYAVPDFELASPMYDRLLAGAALADLGDGRMRVQLPYVPAERILIQLAAGDTADTLKPIEFDAELVEVETDAVPEGVAVTLHEAAGGGDVRLFDHPPVLLPEAGQRRVDFRPLAERTLAEALAAAQGAEPTLGLGLTIASSRPGRLAIRDARLAARYRLDAVLDTRVVLDGGWSALTLATAAARSPAEGRLDLSLRLDGRRLNAATPDPTPAPAGGGLVVTAGRRVAAPVAFAPAGQPLVALRLRLAALEASEVSLALHADAAGLPGAVLGGPLVGQLAAGWRGWLDLPLTEPIAPPERFWLVARVTTGRALWFARAPLPGTDDDRRARLSTDQGVSWAASAATLAQPLLPEAQLIETSPRPLSAPRVRLTSGSAPVDLAAAALWREVAPGELAIDAAPLPAALAALLGSRPGTGRLTLPASLFARDLGRLTIKALTLFYDPSAPPGQAASVGGGP